MRNRATTQIAVMLLLVLLALLANCSPESPAPPAGPETGLPGADGYQPGGTPPESLPPGSETSPAGLSGGGFTCSSAATTRAPTTARTLESGPAARLAAGIAEPNLVIYNDPAGRFSARLPRGWERLQLGVAPGYGDGLFVIWPEDDRIILEVEAWTAGGDPESVLRWRLNEVLEARKAEFPGLKAEEPRSVPAPEGLRAVRIAWEYAAEDGGRVHMSGCFVAGSRAVVAYLAGYPAGSISESVARTLDGLLDSARPSG